MSRSVYNVVGKSTTKPENLPDGLKVEETTVPHEELKVYATGFTTIRVKETSRNGVPIVNICFEGLGQTVSRDISIDTAKKVGQWLLDVVNSHGRLREVNTGHGTVWYEIEPEWFVTAYDRKEAEILAEPHKDEKDVFGYDSLETLLRMYPNSVVSFSS